MEFDFNRSLAMLERTPFVLQALLQGLPIEWTHSNEGVNTWSPFDVLGHLIYCDTHNWLIRIEHIRKEQDQSILPPFDRFGQFELYKEEPLDQLVATFIQTRQQTLAAVQALNIQPADFNTRGWHPQFGQVRLAQLISTWVVHDWNHVAQITRVMAKQYSEAVGPWIEYLPILTKTGTQK